MNESIKSCISTGNEQMDEVLKGGFPANSINIIMGQPGTGKTVFAEQLVFHHALENDRPILYLTTLSEPAAKILTYLQRFSFYDDDKVGTCVYYQDIGEELATGGITAIIPLVEESIHTLSPKIIVIDSFKALHDLAQSTTDMRRMLHKLTGMLTAFETTVFLIGEYTDEHFRTLPEFAIADGIVQFLRNPQSTRDERFVRVIKLRGSGYLEGLHGCKITNAGVEIFPRLVTPELPTDYKVSTERLPSGIPGLDQVIGGGFRRGSCTLLAGPTGAGKTTFGLQFALAGMNSKSEAKSLFLNFQENPTQLARCLEMLQGDSKDNLELMYVSPVEMQVDSLIVALFKRIESEKISRIVVDSVGDLATATSDTQRLHDYLYALVQHFAAKGVTSVITLEDAALVEPSSRPNMGRVSYLSDNIITLHLRHEQKPRRELRCVKARGSDHDLAAHEFSITEHGIKVQS